MTSIGRYEIEAEIGRGMMGVVYAARDPRLDRRVAVKVISLPEGLSEAQRREFHERFRREALAAAGLSHPGIVTVYDTDEDPDGSVPFISMEYVEGPTLEDRLARHGRLEPGEVFGLGADLASALEAAHGAGIVHRDLKPANVLVRSSDGAVKITDFGVARLSASELTRTGTSIGSPGYMSPEQAQGRAVDGRSDLFSLAVLLYQCFCGERPFAGDDLSSLAYSIVHETPVPITKRVAGLPPGLDAFFDRALAKDPAQRFPGAADFARALEQARHAAAAQPTVVQAPSPPTPRATPVPDPPTERPSPARRALSSWGLLAACAGLVVAIAVWASGEDESQAWLQLEAHSSVPEGKLTIRVDGRKVYSRKLETGDNKAVTMLKKVVGKGEENFEALIEVDAGRHEIVARVVTDDKPTGWEDTVFVDLEHGETRRLRLAAGRAFGAPIALKVHRDSGGS